MNRSQYPVLLAALTLLACEPQVDSPDPLHILERESLVVSNEIPLSGLNGDGISDNRKVIQAGIGSNKTLFFRKGTYKVSNFIDVREVTNLKIKGEPGTIITTPENKVFVISGNVKNLEITGVKFVSTKRDQTNDPEGLIFIANYGKNDVMDGININNCVFTNPETHANGIKLVSEGINAVAKNISVKNNRFESIGRFGVEFQNHLSKPLSARFRDYTISDNYFYDVGTIQTPPAPACISVSGYSLNGKINNNQIVEMRMNTSSQIYYGIENAGTVGLETTGNKMKSSKYGFTGILGSGPSLVEAKSSGQPLKNRWIIKNNVMELTGKSDPNKIRGMELTDTENYTVDGNNVNSDGYAMMVINCQTGKIQSNTYRVKAGNVLYFKEGSTKNEITGNLLDGSKGPDHGVVMFYGPKTSGNFATKNTLITTGNKPGKYVNYNGASNNYK